MLTTMLKDNIIVCAVISLCQTTLIEIAHGLTPKSINLSGYISGTRVKIRETSSLHEVRLLFLVFVTFVFNPDPPRPGTF